MRKAYQFEPELIAYDNAMEDFLANDWKRQRTTPIRSRLRSLSSLLMMVALCLAVAVALIMDSGK